MNAHHDQGHATAEYTIGTLGAVMIAFWLSRLAGYLGDPNRSLFGKLIRGLLSKAFEGWGIHGGDWAWRWLM